MKNILLIICIMLLVMPMAFALDRIENYTINDATYEQLGGESFHRGQTFTIGNVSTDDDYNLSHVSMKLYRNDLPSWCNISIFATTAGDPTGNPLSNNATFNCSDITTTVTGQYYNVTMPYMVLNKTTQYALILQVPGGNGSNYAGWRVNQTATYGGGEVVRSVDNASTWSSVPASDLMFEIWGDSFLNSTDPDWAEYSYTYNATTSETSVENFICQPPHFLWRKCVMNYYFIKFFIIYNSMFTFCKYNPIISSTKSSSSIMITMIH